MTKKKKARKRDWDAANVTISASCADLKRLRRMAKAHKTYLEAVSK